MSSIQKVVGSFDRYQRARTWLAFPLAVAKKFDDDQAGYLAALVAYYGFFSLFPLLLVLVTGLGFVLGKNSDLAPKILNSILAQFPIIGDQIRENVHSLKGSGLALGIGILGALWAGMGVVQAMQNGMDQVWGVPFKKKPNFIVSRIRALLMLVVLGVASLAATFLSGIGTAGGSFSLLFKVAGIAASLTLNLGLFLVAFRVLTVEEVSWRDVLPGALVAAVAWALLQAVGGYYVGRQLKDASQVYGLFAIVIGLLSWLYLGAQITLLSAEINVVRARRLWPRSLQLPLTEADERTLRRLAKQEERRQEERVEVGFEVSG